MSREAEMIEQQLKAKQGGGAAATAAAVAAVMGSNMNGSKWLNSLFDVIWLLNYICQLFV